MNEVKAKVLCFAYKLLSCFNRQMATDIFYGGGINHTEERMKAIVYM